MYSITEKAAVNKRLVNIGFQPGSGGAFWRRSVTDCIKPHISKIFFNRLIFIILTVAFHISCSSVSPVSAQNSQHVSFSSIETVAPRWHPVTSGINYINGRINSPQIEFHALRIDLNAPNIQITVKGGGADNSGNTLSAKVSSFVRDNNLIAGINALPFDVSSSFEGRPIKNIGIVVSSGRMISPASSRYDALVFYKVSGDQSKRAAVVSQSSITSIENIENAVGGFYQILADGVPAKGTLNKHPRSAAGISEDGRYLILIVIDGRRLGSAGATEMETAQILLSLGSWNAINFDGGGSSALAMRSADGRVRVVNTPIHNGIPGQERAVAGCLGVRLLE